MTGYARLCALLLIWGCSPAPLPTGVPPSARPDAIRGRSIADRNCSLCHAIGADDASRHPNAPPFRSLLSRRYPLEYLGPALAGGIGAGHLGMPVIEFDPETLDDLRAYMTTLAPAKEQQP